MQQARRSSDMSNDAEDSRDGSDGGRHYPRERAEDTGSLILVTSVSERAAQTATNNSELRGNAYDMPTAAHFSAERSIVLPPEEWADVNKC